MNKKRIEAMNAAGLDVGRYLSLRIDRSEIPEGAEVVFQIRDRDGSIIRKPVQEISEAYFGKNSRFYRRIMEDGHIFSPYIHRRFLPAQFRRNLRYAGHSGIRDYVRTGYGWNYVVRFLSEECWKLAMLQKRDPQAFRERSRFFPLGHMKDVFCDYARVVVHSLDDAVRTPHAYTCGGRKQIYYTAGDLRGVGNIRKEHIRPMRRRFVKFQESVLACRTYAQLSQLVNAFDFCLVDSKIPVCDTFVNCFLQSGAFYTLKHAIMFERLDLGGDSVEGNLAILSEHPQSGLLSLYCRHDR